MVSSRLGAIVATLGCLLFLSLPDTTGITVAQVRIPAGSGGQVQPMIGAIPVVELPPRITMTTASPSKPDSKTADPHTSVSALDFVKTSASYGGCSDDRNRPTTLKDLDAGYKVFFHSLTEESAIEIGVIGFGTAARKKRSVVQVYQFLQYAERSCQTESGTTPVYWGVGTKVVLHIKDAKNNLNLNQITMVAAAVEFRQAEVAYSMDTIGVTGKPILEVLPEAGAFRVDNYGKLVSAIDQVRRLLYDKGVTIRPQLFKAL